MVGVIMGSGLVPTGIPGFDDLVRGGLPRGSVVNISGPTGCGKTVFALQYLYHGITQRDEPGFYISFGAKKRMIYKDVAKFGWNLSDLEKQRKLIFIEYPLHEAAQFISQENALFNMIVELGIERIAIDPVTPLALLYDTEDKRRQGLYTLVNVLRSWGCTSLLLSEPEKEKHLGIEAVCDGVVRMYLLKRKNFRIRALEVVKMYGIDFVSKTCPVRITGSGISVYPNLYLFED
ncbi:MAG: ATPase domain-containing protein [Candidatus Micrarchaeia archaeon]